MDQTQQAHRGIGDNVGGDKIIINHNIHPATPRSKYINAFTHYNLVNLVGREQQLEEIKNHLDQHNLLLLHGIGGIGKTTLAKAYISKSKNKYDHIAYVEITGSIADSLLIQLCNSPEISLTCAPENRFDALIEYLRCIPKLLLVLNNANDADELRLRKPQLSSLDATVLITGRALPISFVKERNVLYVQALTPDEAFRLFSNHYTIALSEQDKTVVNIILKESFYHAKLVEIIAKSAYQANAFVSLEEISQIVSKKQYQDAEINFPIEVDEQSKKIHRVLLDLFDTDHLSEDACQLLRYFSTLPTIYIPVQDLATLLQLESVFERQALISSLNSLVRAGWLEESDNRYFSMHGLVQWVVRQRLLPTASNCEPLIQGMAKALYHELTENPLEKQRFLVYSTEWLQLFENDLNEKLATCYSNLAIIYAATGNYQQQLAYSRKSLAIEESMLPVDHPDIASSYINLAGAYGTMGDHLQRLSYNQKALTIREKVLSSNHPDLAKSYNNIADNYGALGDYPQALTYNQKALAIRENVLSRNDPDLAYSYNNIAHTYGALGDHSQALIYNKKALAIREEILSPNHPDLARSCNNIAHTYGALGDHSQALIYNKKALAIREKVLSTNHPELAQSYNNLAENYRMLRDYLQALTYHQKALAIREQVLLPSHPYIANSYRNLAATHLALGNLEQSHSLMQKAIAMKEQNSPLDELDLIHLRDALAHIEQVLQGRKDV